MDDMIRKISAELSNISKEFAKKTTENKTIIDKLTKIEARLSRIESKLKKLKN